MTVALSDPRQAAYEETRAYFARPDAVLAKEQLDPDKKWAETVCQYRTKSGDCCAIGCRLSDAWIAANGGEKYINDCGNIDGLTRSVPEVQQIIGVRKSKLWNFHSATQGMHDNVAKDAADFVRLLDEFAAQIGLHVVTS